MKNNEVIEVKRAQVSPDPDQPRKVFDKEKLAALAENIRALGIQEPLKVEARGSGYVLVDGERRWRAAGLAGLETVPVIVRAPDAKRKLGVQLALNQQRENLTALEEAAAYAKAVAAGKKAEELAKELGVSRATVFGRLALQRVTAPVRKSLEAGNITASVAGLLAMVPEGDQEEALEDVEGTKFEGPASFREAQEQVERHYVRQLKEAPFDTKVIYPGTLARTATCVDCPKRSGNMEGCGLANQQVCTDPKCYDAKTAANAELKLKEAKARGLAVLPEKEAKEIFNGYRGSLNDRSGWVDLNDRCEPLGYDYKNHWRAALGNKAPALTVAIGPDGAAHELVKRSEALAALKANGKLATGVAATSTRKLGDWEIQEKRRDKKRQARLQVLAAAEKAATPELLRKLAPNGTVAAAAWGFLARAAYDTTGIDTHAMVAKRRGLSENQNGARAGIEKWLKEKHTPKEHAEFAVELLVCGQPYAGGNWGEPHWNKEYAEACAWAGVNLKKLERK